LTTGGDNKNKWIDFVIYSGAEKEFNFEKLQEAILGFLVTLNNKTIKPISPIKINESGDYFVFTWNRLTAKALKKPYSERATLVLK